VSGQSLDLDQPDLLQAVRSGERAALGRVLELCLPSLRRIVSSRFKLSPQECDDILQEVQVAFLAAASRFRGQCTLHTYLVQIACRKCVDYLRRRRREAQYWQQVGPDQVAVDNDDALERLADRLAVEEVLRCLTPRERLLLELFYAQGKSYKEIAAEMGIAIGSVGAMKAEALLKLREAFSTPAEEVRDEPR